MNRDDVPKHDMRDLASHLYRSDPLALDDVLAERLLSGHLEPDDAPPGYREVVEALMCLATAPTTPDRAVEKRAVAAIAGVLADDRHDSTRRPARRGGRRAVRSIALGVIVSASLLGGMAAANVLPRPAQRLAAHVLRQVGVDVPDPGTDTRLPPGDLEQSPVSETLTVTPRSSTGHERGGVTSPGARGDASRSTTPTVATTPSAHAAVPTPASTGPGQAGGGSSDISPSTDANSRSSSSSSAHAQTPASNGNATNKSKDKH